MKFTKMHGLGNDFIVIADTQKHADLKTLAQKLCSRHTGVGADGLLIVEQSDTADIRMRIINSDGSEAEMCGNGIRCFAKYVYEQEIVKKEKMVIQTLAGLIKPELTIQNGKVVLVKVDMGMPSFEAEKIPTLAQNPMDVQLEIAGQTVQLSAVLMGVPHAIVFVEDLQTTDIDTLGEKIEKHDLFPHHINVDFVQIINRNTLRMETWERGAGRTLACGTGATAAGVIAYKKGFCEPTVKVLLSQGSLQIEYMQDKNAFMSGPAQTVFCGEIL
ncbi:MAG: diaminopimelate epimerase [Christensenellaceae bacterium]